MEKVKRKSDIGLMTLVAGIVHQMTEEDGICGVDSYCDSRMFDIGKAKDLTFKPGVQMQPKKFLEYFGDDTNFEYISGNYHTEMITEVNGVVFHAIVCSMDFIVDGEIA